MTTYYIPRNVKGEGRILYIFSTKALIYTCIGAGIGFFIKYFLQMLDLNMVGWIIMGILGLIGFAIGTLKVPDIKKFEITRKTAGLNIDEVIKIALKFKNKKNKIYVCEKEAK